MNILTEEEAIAAGMQRLTTPYRIPRDQAMLDNALGDMERGKIHHAVVPVTILGSDGEPAEGAEIWRAGMVFDHGL
jgi:hypothetical protein